jgi:hypothetical protein
MKGLGVKSLLLAALVTPITVHAQEETAAASSRSEPGSLSVEESRTVSADGDVGYLPVLSNYTVPNLGVVESGPARLLVPDLDALRASEQRRVILEMPSSSSLAHALKRAFEKRQPLGDLVLTTEPTGQEVKYYTITLKNARVVSISPSTSDGIPMEQVSFVYEEIDWNY